MYYVELNNKYYGIELTDDVASIEIECDLLGELAIGGKNCEELYEVEDIWDLSSNKEDEENDGIYATMPGKVISILVKEGDEVKEGQVLAILESMKMENEIVSTKDGIIKKINIEISNQVEMGKEIMTLYGA